MAEEDSGGQQLTAELEPAEHVIRMVAAVSLVWSARGWVVEEDPVARLDRDDELMCTEEGHVLSGAGAGAVRPGEGTRPGGAVAERAGDRGCVSAGGG